MRRQVSVFCAIFFALGVFVIFTAGEALAVPAFSRQIEDDCTVCHSAFPKLNEAGRIFRDNGFRFPEDTEWKEVKDLASLPVSAEIVVEGEINNDENSAGLKRSQESKFFVEEFELFVGAPIGKEGKVAVYGVLEAERVSANEPDVEDSVDVSIATAWFQVNDLVGETGKGLLNMRAGRWDVSLPFLAHNERVIKNRYIAQNSLEILGDGMTGIELNGQIIGEEETTQPTHRYRLGVARPDFNERNRLSNPNLYASYAINFLEHYTLGAIYKRDVETAAAPNTGDEALSRYGFAGAVEWGPFIGTVGYFLSEATDDKDFNNLLVEALFLPTKKVVLGMRYDLLDKEDKKSGNETTLTGRYNIMSSVYVLAEYRLRGDKDNIIGTADRQERGRAYLVALF